MFHFFFCETNFVFDHHLQISILETVFVLFNIYKYFFHSFIKILKKLKKKLELNKQQKKNVFISCWI